MNKSCYGKSQKGRKLNSFTYVNLGSKSFEILKILQQASNLIQTFKSTNILLRSIVMLNKVAENVAQQFQLLRKNKENFPPG